MFSAEALLDDLTRIALDVTRLDPYTGGHLRRSARYSRILASAAGFDAAQVARITLGGFLHDVGKLKVPAALLSKAGPLNPSERATMQGHTTVGAALIANHRLGNLVIGAVLSHHERMDGEGYPRKLRGDQIPLDARVVSIVDAFDAMTTQRPYRQPLRLESAIEQLHLGLGTQFDEGLGRTFIRLATAGVFDDDVAYSNALEIPAGLAAFAHLVGQDIADELVGICEAELSESTLRRDARRVAQAS
ncbi:MAG: HD domain-containing protein [Myxococcales bacterium]|nr:HD domain-containing protein [Myxococcales bacterium]